MLKSLSIRNVVLIDKLDLDFQAGFSVLSGETGAGKSILLDSVGMLLGRRVETDMIRSGCDKLSVIGCFEVDDDASELRHLCQEYELEFSPEIVIKRTLSADGKNKIFFNDEPITQKLLKEIGACLVEIHGQFDNQGLLNPATHRAVLDNYGGYAAALQEMRETYQTYQTQKRAYETAAEQYAIAQQDEENLHHWVAELEKVKPQENETEDLENRRRQMMNAEKIINNLNTAHQALNNSGVGSSLRQAQTAVARVNAILENRFSGLAEVLDVALINVEEAETQINTAISEVNLSQNDLDAIEERLFTLKSLARKHQVAVQELPQLWREMAQKLAHLEHGGENLAELEKQKQQAWADYAKKAEQITAKRQAAAKKLDAKIMAELPDLKMEKARFVTQLKAKPAEQWNENGAEDVCFAVSTNSGTPLGPLSKIASGGELARFMLAIKVNLAQNMAAGTMIFDEVDTGIGGATAQAVGAKLAELGQKTQVLVVTHSPQVAAQSAHHFKVEKRTENNVTTTYLRTLDANQKREEIARMLSGAQISDEARAAAEVLIGA